MHQALTKTISVQCLCVICGVTSLPAEEIDVLGIVNSHFCQLSAGCGFQFLNFFAEYLSLFPSRRRKAVRHTDGSAAGNALSIPLVTVYLAASDLIQISVGCLIPVKVKQWQQHNRVDKNSWLKYGRYNNNKGFNHFSSSTAEVI